LTSALWTNYKKADPSDFAITDREHVPNRLILKLGYETTIKLKLPAPFYVATRVPPAFPAHTFMHIINVGAFPVSNCD
jgi:hypothetical protein